MANYVPAITANTQHTNSLSTLFENAELLNLASTPAHVAHTKQNLASVKKVVDVVEEAKKLAAYTAVDRHVKPEHKVIGIGSGSTVPYVVDRILAQGAEVNKGRWFIPTGQYCLSICRVCGLDSGIGSDRLSE